MPDRLWKIAATLGVPGLALAIFFSLYNKFGFTFAPVPQEWTGPIAALFLVLTAIVVAIAIVRHRSGTSPGEKTSEPAVPRGYRRLRVLVLARNMTRTIARADLPKTVPWNQAANGFVVGFELPQDPSLYRLLDVERGKWLEAPHTIGGLSRKSRVIALVHKEDAATYHNEASTVASVLRALSEIGEGRRPQGA